MGYLEADKRNLFYNHERAYQGCEEGMPAYVRTPLCIWTTFGGGSTPNYLQKSLCHRRREFYWPEGENSYSPDCYGAEERLAKEGWDPQIAMNLHRAVYCCRSEKFEPNNIPIKRNLTTPSLTEDEFNGYHKDACRLKVIKHWPQGWDT